MTNLVEMKHLYNLSKWLIKLEINNTSILQTSKLNSQVSIRDPIQTRAYSDNSHFSNSLILGTIMGLKFLLCKILPKMAISILIKKEWNAISKSWGNILGQTWPLLTNLLDPTFLIRSKKRRLVLKILFLTIYLILIKLW